MESMETQPHLSLNAQQVRAVVIVVGDPKRAEAVAKSCDKYKELAYNREYRSFDCSKNGQNFTVASHGVGSAGAAICFEELIKLGAKVLIRAGTAGSLQPSQTKQEDIIVCHSAAREDGVTDRYVPKGYPAIADSDIFNALTKTAETLKILVKTGSSLTCDLFYASPVIPGCLETYAKAGIDIVEMEISTLFVISRIRKVKAAALCCIDGCPFKWDEGCYTPSSEKINKAKKQMIEVATTTAATLAEQYCKN